MTDYQIIQIRWQSSIMQFLPSTRTDKKEWQLVLRWSIQMCEVHICGSACEKLFHSLDQHRLKLKNILKVIMEFQHFLEVFSLQL